MNPIASKFYALARVAHPTTSRALLRKAADAFAVRHPHAEHIDPDHVASAVVAHVRHTKTSYESKWRKDQSHHKTIKYNHTMQALQILDTKFKHQPLPKPAVRPQRLAVPQANAELGAIMDAME